MALEIRREGELLSLSPKEFLLLKTLLEHPGTSFTHEDLSAIMHREDGAPTKKRAITNLIYRLRQKVEPTPANPTYIISVPGGYVMREPSSESPD